MKARQRLQNTNNDHVDRPEAHICGASNFRKDEDYNGFSYLPQKPIQPRTLNLLGQDYLVYQAYVTAYTTYVRTHAY
jgi:hypothetical protein